jgi:ankyrin repeat protein
MGWTEAHSAAGDNDLGQSSCASRPSLPLLVFFSSEFSLGPLGAWCLGLGAWCLVLGAWCLVLGVWCLGFGAWCSDALTVAQHIVLTRRGALPVVVCAEALKEIKAAGANLDEVDGAGLTPLHVACSEGSLQAVQFLLE